jgi:hypothetical protein
MIGVINYRVLQATFKSRAHTHTQAVTHNALKNLCVRVWVCVLWYTKVVV